MAKAKYTEALNGALEKVFSEQNSLEGTRYNNIADSNKLDKQEYKDYYSSVIRKSDTNIDAFCDIKNYYLDGPAVVGSTTNTAQKIRVRDARMANGKKPEESSDSWIQGMAAQGRAVSILLDNVEVKSSDSKAKIEKQTYDLFKSYSKLMISEQNSSASEKKSIVDNFSYEIASLLKQDESLVVNGKRLADRDIKKIGKIINDVRDFGNFEESSHHTMTISKEVGEQKKNIVWFSSQMNPVSEEIKEEYSNIQGKHWFQKLTPLQQNLVKQYQGKIVSGDHIIPTQLRYLPGLKNCYMDLYGNVNNGKVEKAHIAPHSGTMVHGGGSYGQSDEVNRITEMQIKHSKDLTGKMGANVMHLQVLNSSGIGTRAADPTDRNLCITMDNVAAKINTRDKDINYNRAGINSFAESDPLNNIDEMTKKAVAIDKKGGEVFWAKCKSGKDRTFMVLFNNMSNILGDSKDDKQKREIADALLYSNHAETMASSAGGSRGAVGLKLGGTYVRLFWTDRLNPINRKGKNHILGNNTAKHWQNKISYINTVHPVEDKKISKKVRLYSDIEDKQELLKNNKNTQEQNSSTNNQAPSYQNNVPNYTIPPEAPSYQTPSRPAYAAQVHDNNTKSDKSKNWTIAAGVVMGLVVAGPVGAVIGGGLAYSLENTKTGAASIVAVGVATLVAAAFIGPGALVIPAIAFGVAKYSEHLSRKKQEASMVLGQGGPGVNKSRVNQKGKTMNLDPSPPSTPSTGRGPSFRGRGVS